MGAGVSRRFGRKQKAIPEPVRQPLHKFGNAQLTRHFRALTDDLDRAMQAVPKGKPAQQQLKINLERVFDTALRLDSYRLSKEDAANLTDALYVTLPRAVEDLISETYEWGSWEDSWDAHDYDLTSIQRIVSIVVRAQMDPDYLSCFQSPEPATLVEAPEADSKAKASFPSLRPLTPEVDAKVQELSQLWAATNGLPVAIEDRYLLDRMVERYLPDTWQMIGIFNNIPEELRDSAVSMVLDQLQILTHQISEIHQRAAGNSLDSLRTQTEFIRAQHEQRRASNLSLETDPF